MRGSSQQETLAKLIETFEFQAGKAVLTEKKAHLSGKTAKMIVSFRCSWSKHPGGWVWPADVVLWTVIENIDKDW